MQESGNPPIFEFRGLIGAPARDQGERRMKLADHRHLLGAKLRRHEAKNSNSPGSSTKVFNGFVQEFTNVVPTQHGQRQKR